MKTNVPEDHQRSDSRNRLRSKGGPLSTPGMLGIRTRRIIDNKSVSTRVPGDENRSFNHIEDGFFDLKKIKPVARVVIMFGWTQNGNRRISVNPISTSYDWGILKFLLVFSCYIYRRKEHYICQFATTRSSLRRRSASALK